MSSKLYLPTVDAVDEGTAVVFIFPKMPAMTGDEDENLACGSCKTVVARGVSTRTLHERNVAPDGAFVKCDCGKYVQLPFKR
jgi:hypothetical protein